jgi:hypothetical protein
MAVIQQMKVACCCVCKHGIKKDVTIHIARITIGIIRYKLAYPGRAISAKISCAIA